MLAHNETDITYKLEKIEICHPHIHFITYIQKALVQLLEGHTLKRSKEHRWSQHIENETKHDKVILFTLHNAPA